MIGFVEMRVGADEGLVWGGGTSGSRSEMATKILFSNQIIEFLRFFNFLGILHVSWKQHSVDRLQILYLKNLIRDDFWACLLRMIKVYFFKLKLLSWRSQSLLLHHRLTLKIFLNIKSLKLFLLILRNSRRASLVLTSEHIAVLTTAVILVASLRFIRLRLALGINIEVTIYGSSLG